MVGTVILYIESQKSNDTDDKEQEQKEEEPTIVDKQPNPKNGPPDTTTRTVDENGNPIQDRTFGPDGKAEYDIDYTDHGNPKHHPTVPHQHDWDWTDPKNPVRGPGHCVNN